MLALRCIFGVAVDSEVVMHLSTVLQWLLVVIPVPEDVQVVACGDATQADQAFSRCWRIVVSMLYSILVLRCIGSQYYCGCVGSFPVL